MRAIVGIAFLAFVFGGCNFFSSFDKPSGDPQLLAAARACFDQGDYACATQYYTQLSSSYADTENSELAFEILAQNGATMSNFMSAVIAGSSSGGTLITQIANSLTSVANKTTRLAFFHAYQKVAKVNDRATRGLVRFITSITLLGELLAEAATKPGKFSQSDLVVDPKGCAAAKIKLNTSCNAPSGTVLITGTAITLSPTTTTDAEIVGTGAPTLFLVNALATEINTAISELNTQGSLGSSAGTFSTSLTASSVTDQLVSGNDSVFRGTLLDLGVGEQ